ncbi:MAG: alpha/beta hydrolase [Pseudomonadales bacterium]|jgi:pimeloyl-ACP methyl ester carboxylesterase|nr:alpha/beta hydrolase [Pseudomonadales bacterium]MCP5333907.1 alpha/beta hydrolase [Pseudomonadales bacterium]HMU89580.1 alpha/beta hydrolase [Pseudomonadales bacterium]HMW15160.1 alpha/beta hydrolase [Pseudomonadales bacterium]HMW82595.1 alpha/beta hydrolase [Pseudomonadales bacterium]
MLTLHPDAPDWFRRVLAITPQSRFVEVEGCPIHYLLWGDEGDKPGLLFVHGNGAHAHWWDFIAPFFIDQFRVAAMDLSGMGDSGHRAAYDGDCYASELMSVIDDAGFGDGAIIVGHSMGGFITLRTGALHGDRLTGIVLADAPIRPPDYEWHSSAPIRRRKLYPDFESAVARFRLLPPQPCANDYILDYIARHSLVAVEGGWMWKFDEHFRSPFLYEKRRDDFKNLRCRCGVINADQSSVVTPEVGSYMFRMLDESVPFVTVPETHHHLFLDQPLAFVAALRTMLAEWRHSNPHRGR